MTDLYNRLMTAFETGRGARLSPEEVETLVVAHLTTFEACALEPDEEDETS